MNIKVKRLSENAVIPTRGSDGAAGYDLYSTEAATIASGVTTAIHTGISIELAKGYFGGIFARSGIAIKRGLRPANCTGIIDEDYRGEVIVALHNDSGETQYIEPGERVAQLIVIPYEKAEFTESDTLEETVRGSGGFGSTGRK